MDTNKLKPETALPSWLPQKARDAYVEACRNAKKRGARETNIVTMLNRLFTSDEMKSVWTSLDSKGNDDKNNNYGFTDAVVDAYIGPWGTSTLTPSERIKKHADITQAAKRLADLVRDTEYDCYPVYRKSVEYREYVFAKSHFGEKNLKNLSVHEEVIVQNLLTRDWMSELLIEFADEFQTLMNPPMQKPNDPQAARAYFVRELTNYFRQEFGGPKRKWVTTTTSVVLEDEHVTERQVTRLAPTPGTKSSKSTK